MRDTELYQRLLGLEPPWKVARVELDVKQQRVDGLPPLSWTPRLARECARSDP
jgi:hypothetical protein